MFFQKSEKFSALIGKGVVNEGSFEADGTARIDGTVNGDVTVTGRLILGREAVVKGNITANSILLGGEVLGNVAVTDRADLLSTAKLRGDLTAKVLVIDKGAFFCGQCKMKESKDEK